RDGWIEIDIADNGPGVAAGDRRRVFRKFQRGKSVSGNAVPGLGLGLSIVERFATTAGGRVELLDTPAPGATFRLTLPRHAENKEGRDA
ncbi:MAG TPA: ATP-binding protein, partial [Myxococcota bacterium]|nr:ATP-binding protein [Myxococcota bacterium]